MINSFPARKNLCLPDFDYSNDGAYFVTIVAQTRVFFFGSIINEEMVLNDAGKMVNQVCQEMPYFLPGMHFDIYQIMPIHFHAIIRLENLICKKSKSTVGAGTETCLGQPQRVAPTQNRVSLPNVVQRFKSLTTSRYIDGVHQHQWRKFDQRLWLRNYYEHIICDVQDYHSGWHYTQANPQN